MALIAKKTYSRKKDHGYKTLKIDKENVDPFDKLLSSPLKNDVDFKPLSYFEKKSGENKCENKWLHNETVTLYKFNTSRNLSSPVFGEMKKNWKSQEGKSTKKNLKSNSHHNLQFKQTLTLEKSDTIKVANSCMFNNKIPVSSSKKRDSFHYVTKRRYKNQVNGCNWFSVANDTASSNIEIYNPSSEKNSVKCESCSSHNRTYIISDKTNDQTLNKSKNNFYSNFCKYDGILYVSGQAKYSLTSNVGDNIYQGSFGYTLHSQAMGDEEVATLCGSPNSFDYSLDVPDSGENIEMLVPEFLSEKDGTCNYDVTNSNIHVKNNSVLIGSDDSTLCENSQSIYPCNSLNLDIENNEVQSKSISSDVFSLASMVSNMTIRPSSSPRGNTKTDRKVDKTPEEDKNILKSMNSPLESVFPNVVSRRRYASPCKIKLFGFGRAPLAESTKAAGKENIRFSQVKKNPTSRESNEEFNVRTAMEKPQKRLQNITFLESSRFSFAPNPIFESTRIQEREEYSEMSNITEYEDTLYYGNSITLKHGKKWMRSMSVLRQLQNESITLKSLDNKGDKKGRNYERFVTQIAEMQNGLQQNNSLKRFSQANLRWTAFNHTVKVMRTDNSFETSIFRSALECQNNDYSIQSDEDHTLKGKSFSVTAKDVLLNYCGQTEVLPFEDYFNENTLKNCKKIGEGVYGEVFMYNSDTVLKVIPIEGRQHVNGEPQKKFEEIVSEVVIAAKLSNLRFENKCRTSGFSELKRCWCVFGKYPQLLLDLWNEYDNTGNGSENDSPVMFGSDQLYIILELANGGKDLEAFTFNSAEQSYSAFMQTVFSLAAAEKAFEFEHRDLHWGNLLLSHTKEKFMTVKLNDIEYKIPTKGIQVCIIDFTLSRILHEGCCIFNDLSVDQSLFESQGDYQFEIYRMMQRELNNEWSNFNPRTNLFWLHYTLDKMLKVVRYKNKSSQVHKKHYKQLKMLESCILDYESCENFVTDMKLA